MEKQPAGSQDDSRRRKISPPSLSGSIDNVLLAAYHNAGSLATRIVPVLPGRPAGSTY